MNFCAFAFFDFCFFYFFVFLSVSERKECNKETDKGYSTGPHCQLLAAVLVLVVLLRSLRLLLPVMLLNYAYARIQGVCACRFGLVLGRQANSRLGLL